MDYHSEGTLKRLTVVKRVVVTLLMDMVKIIRRKMHYKTHEAGNSYIE